MAVIINNGQVTGQNISQFHFLPPGTFIGKSALFVYESKHRIKNRIQLTGIHYISLNLVPVYDCQCRHILS